MIAEPAESDAERADIGAEAQSESDALSTIQPASIEEEVPQEIEDHIEETPASEVELTEQEAELRVNELSGEITNEEETKPVEIQPILEDKPDDQVDEDYTEVAETVEQVQSLEFAKTQFEQGNIEKAIEIIAALEVGPDNMQYLDEMERTLIDEVNSTAKDNADAWEFLGDIALLKKKPEEAFDAYKQAIQLLVAEKKDTDGTD
jgi:tetratricopeptide (TPR) repeat protein